MKMVEALIQTGKPYDLIVLPEEGHDPRTRARGRFLSEGFSSCELTGSLQGCQGRVGPDTLQVRLTPPGGPRGGVQVVSRGDRLGLAHEGDGRQLQPPSV